MTADDTFEPAAEDTPPEIIGQGADLEPRRAPRNPDPLPDYQEDRSPNRARRSPEPRTPSREVPASQEAEEHVIACILIDGDTLPRAVQAGLTPASFYYPATRTVFTTLLDMQARGVGISDATLIQEMGARLLGGLPWLMQVTAKIPTTAHAGYFISSVREKQLLRDTIRAATQTVEDAYSFTGGLDEFLATAEARQASIRTGTGAEKKAVLATRLQARRVQHTNKPPEPVTRLYLADKPIATPGNLVTLISRAKTGKTAVLGAATAAIITAAAGTQILGRDTFKFRASNPQGHAVIVIDTEQSKYDAWVCYQRALKRAGDETDPPWLHHYSLVGDTPFELLQELDLAIEHGVTTCKAIFVIILDGCADFVASVNDEAECNGFVTTLRKRATDHDCPILAVIHSNEAEKSGDDGRGHLGKQLIRKAESNLLLKKTDDVTIITSDKQRKAPITESDGVAFRWSDEAQMHVSTTPEGKKKAGGRTRAHDIHEFWECIPKPGQPALTGTQIHRFATQVADIKPNTFKDLLAAAVTDGLLTRTYDPKAGFSYVQAGPAPVKTGAKEPDELPPWQE